MNNLPKDPVPGKFVMAGKLGKNPRVPIDRFLSNRRYPLALFSATGAMQE